MNEYKYRGWFWGGTALCTGLTIVTRIILMLLHKSELSVGDFIGGVGVFAVLTALFIHKRRQSQEKWEDMYGVSDEREALIRGQAAVTTLKLIAIALFFVNYAGELISDSLVFSGVRFLAGILLAVGALTYYLLLCAFDRKV